MKLTQKELDEALRWASLKGYIEIVRLLLEKGADVHANNNSALRWAIYNGHIAVVNLLKTYKPNQDA